jgi:DNA end-binding protein Ku
MGLPSQLKEAPPTLRGNPVTVPTARAGHFDPAEFEDRYENAVVEMLKQKQAGIPVRKEAPVAAPSTVINLMDALRRSVQAERPAAKKGKPAEKVGRQSGKRKAG